MNLVILGKPNVLSNFLLKVTIAVQLVLGNIDLFTLFHLFIIGIAGKIKFNSSSPLPHPSPLPFGVRGKLPLPPSPQRGKNPIIKGGGG